MRWRPDWASPYPREHLTSDVLAGIVTALLVIPQSLAYALLAGLPPQAGLYVSILPAIAYAWLGSSRVQAVGPVAITSIMTYAVLSPLATPGTGTYISLAATLALGSGILLIAAAQLRLGFLAQLLSRPVTAGFISGSALLIVLSQLQHLFSFQPQQTSAGAVITAWLTQGRWDANSWLGVAALLILGLARWYAPRHLPAAPAIAARVTFFLRLLPLLLVLVATALVAHLALGQTYGLHQVGGLTPGLPALQLSLPSLDDSSRLLLPMALLALIGMVQNMSMAQALASRRCERVDANAELNGLGWANILAAGSGGMPVGGGVSRTAINVAAGAQTPLASIVAALVMLLIVLTAAPLFAHVPLAVLAASIITAAIGMVDIKAMRRAWRHDRADGIAALGTALGVCLLGLEVGIALGVLFSLATHLYRASTPHIAVVGRIPGSSHFRNVARHQVETLPQVLFLRIDESLFFGNLAAVENRLRDELAHNPTLRDVVLIMSAVNWVDASAAEMLANLADELTAAGINLHLAEVKGPVQDSLDRAPLWHTLQGRVFLSANDAFETLGARTA